MLPYALADVNAAVADYKKLKEASYAFGAKEFPFKGIEELLKKL